MNAVDLIEAGPQDIGIPGWAMSAITDIGRVRLHNEDCVALVPEQRAAVLADGMGGHAAGDIASRTAVRAAAEFLSQRAAHRMSLTERVRKASRIAHEAVLSAAYADLRLSGMGTTLVVIQFGGKRLSVAHLGDSRLYRWRKRRLVRLTRDHSAAEELVQAGLLDRARADRSPQRHVLTRAAGLDPADADVCDYRWQVNDLYLLCSDGLTDAIGDHEIAALLDDAVDLGIALRALVTAANDHGGPDNISAILIRTGNSSSTIPP